MRYLGSKRRFVGQILPILMEHAESDTVFVDAFCGGCNVLSNVPLHRKFGVDVNRYMIAFWEKVTHEFANGLPYTCMPRSYTEDFYMDVRRSYCDGDGKYDDALIGYVGSAGSWGGGWFKGYPHYNPNKKEDHLKEAYNGVEKQLRSWYGLHGTKFICASYDEFDYPDGSIIYCDPPYRGTTGYEKDREFDHARFWEWVRVMSRKGHHVYVSEYEAPDDFECVWSAVKPDGLGTCRAGESQKRKIERLYVYRYGGKD